MSCTGGCLVQGGVLYRGVSCTGGCLVQGGVLYRGVSCTGGCLDKEVGILWGRGKGG